ncbi:hypothetical protein FKK04_28675, partial [Klebsiella pneumoniae]|nr:hypothetical protein [Klebsiella pneumoniae]
YRFWRRAPRRLLNKKAFKPADFRRWRHCCYTTRREAIKLEKLAPRFYVSTSKSIIKALINMHSFEIQLSPIG